MRKLFAMAVILGVVTDHAIACNCGSGSYSGGGSSGMLSRFNSNFAGLSWEHRKIESRSSGLEESNSHFQFNTVELAGKFFPTKRFFLSAAVPYHINQRSDSGYSQNMNGFGDFTLSAGYMLLKPADSLCRAWNHSLALMAGLKMPTGKYESTGSDLQDFYMQPGTGSWDVVFSAAYTFRYRKFGVQADASYRANTANREGIRFGNRLSASANGFYSYRKGKFNIIPSAGMMFETAAKDVVAAELQTASGGNIVFATAALNVHYRSVGAGFNFQQPAYQNIADGSLWSKPKWMLQVYYLF